MPYALIEGGIVKQLWLPESPPEGYIAVPDFVQPGYTLDGGNWVAPVPEDGPGPVEVEPVRVACALRVPVVDGEVQQIGGAYRVMATYAE